MEVQEVMDFIIDIVFKALKVRIKKKYRKLKYNQLKRFNKKKSSKLYKEFFYMVQIWVKYKNLNKESLLLDMNFIIPNNKKSSFKYMETTFIQINWVLKISDKKIMQYK